MNQSATEDDAARAQDSPPQIRKIDCVEWPFRRQPQAFQLAGAERFRCNGQREFRLPAPSQITQFEGHSIRRQQDFARAKLSASKTQTHRIRKFNFLDGSVLENLRPARFRRARLDRSPFSPDRSFRPALASPREPDRNPTRKWANRAGRRFGQSHRLRGGQDRNRPRVPSGWRRIRPAHLPGREDRRQPSPPAPSRLCGRSNLLRSMRIRTPPRSCRARIAAAMPRRKVPKIPRPRRRSQPQRGWTPEQAENRWTTENCPSADGKRLASCDISWRNQNNAVPKMRLTG